MDIVEIFEQSETPALMGSLLCAIADLSSRGAEGLASICLTRSIKSSLGNPLNAWKLTATLSQTLPKCTDGYVLKNAQQIEKIYDDAFIGISRELDLLQSAFFQSAQKASLAKVVIMSYGDLSLRFLSMRGGHQIKPATLSTLLAFLSHFPQFVLTYNCEPSVMDLSTALDICLCICQLLIKLQRSIQIRTLLRSRAVELRASCFGILIAMTYAHSYLSQGRIEQLIEHTASLFTLVILSLESRAIRYEVGAELMRVFVVFKYMAEVKLFDNLELSILDGYTVISTIGRMLGVSASSVSISFWRDHPILGNTRFARFLHRFSHSCSMFLSVCVRQALNIPTTLIEYEIPVEEQTFSMRNDPCPILLYPVAGILDLMCACTRTFLNKMTTCATFRDIVSVFLNFSRACSFFLSADFGLSNGLKAMVFWPVAQLLAVPVDVLLLIKPGVYRILGSLLTTSSLTLPLDNRLYNERFHSFSTVVSVLHDDIFSILQKKGSREHQFSTCPQEIALGAAKLFKAICMHGQSRLLTAYASALQDTGCPLLADIVTVCFRIVLMYVRHLRENTVIKTDSYDNLDNKASAAQHTSTLEQRKLMRYEDELYTHILEALTYLALTPINGALSSALPLTVHFINVSLTDRLLKTEYMQRLATCQYMLALALLPVTPQFYHYGIKISPDLMLTYGISEPSEVSLESLASMAGASSVSEPVIKRDRPSLLPYLPIISIDCHDVAPAKADVSESTVTHSESLVSIDVTAAHATPCPTASMSVISSMPTISHLLILPSEKPVAKLLVPDTPNNTEKGDRAVTEAVPLNLDSSEDEDS